MLEFDMSRFQLSLAVADRKLAQGHRYNYVSRLWRIVMACLLVPSISGVSACQMYSAEAHARQAPALLPIRQLVSGTVAITERAGTNDHQAHALARQTGHGLVCLVSHDTTPSKSIFGLHSMPCDLALPPALAGAPIFAMPAPPEAIFLHTAFTSPLTPPPRT
ncbi:MAG: hypothetical protein HYY29_00630 [Chloroflexi bacterium]|nr:hypothetical protein [Chloroflexota bacterium]